MSYALAALLAGAIAAAALVVGPASGASSTQTRIVTAQRGVVQSTVSGSGNVASWRELDLGFKASGTVTHIYVKQGQRVAQGRLLATLDPHSAEVTLEQAKANLQSAEAALAREEETNGESASSSSSPPANAASNSGAHAEAATATVADTQGTTTSPQSEATPSTRTTQTTTPSASSEVSSATREANIASARAAVKSDRLTVENDERGVADTRLTAPQDGTIVSLGGEVGKPSPAGARAARRANRANPRADPVAAGRAARIRRAAPPRARRNRARRAARSPSSAT